LLDDFCWVFEVVLYDLFPNFVFYQTFHLIFPKWILNMMIWRYGWFDGILELLLFYASFYEKDALGTTTLLLTGDVFTNTKYLIIVLILLWNLMTKFIKSVAIPLECMLGMSHLACFHVEMDVELRVWCCNYHIFRWYFVKYLVAKSWKIFLFQMFNKLYHRNQIDFFELLVRQLLKHI
jgi:hypothetical protein